MQDKELLINANEYIKKLANGINPLTNTLVNENDIINDEKISKCLFLVSNIIDEYLNEKFYIKVKKETFHAKKEDLLLFKYSEPFTYISKIVDQINNIVKNDNMKKLVTRGVRDWLVYK